jgi:hypothetical protein
MIPKPTSLHPADAFLAALRALRRMRIDGATEQQLAPLQAHLRQLGRALVAARPRARIGVTCEALVFRTSILIRLLDPPLGGGAVIPFAFDTERRKRTRREAA